jgi:hypothetical protein
MIARVVIVLAFWVMALITLVAGVIILLGIGWLAVAVPVLVLIGAISAVIALWRRWWPPRVTDGSGR